MKLNFIVVVVVIVVASAFVDVDRIELHDGEKKELGTKAGNCDLTAYLQSNAHQYDKLFYSSILSLFKIERERS